MSPPAHVTKLLEGTNYVTVSLILPSIYRLLEGLSSSSIFFVLWKPPGRQWTSASQLTPSVKAARALLQDDLQRRWIDEMPGAQRDELDISILLDPRFKQTYEFPGIQDGDMRHELREGPRHGIYH